MRVLSLFSGIGGLDLAAEWAGMETIAFCERDKFCQKVLAKHWPNVPIFSNNPRRPKFFDKPSIFRPEVTVIFITHSSPCV